MHAKHKGTIGEMAVTQDLLSQGYHVFTELGDLSKVDLIALDPATGELYKIQVKYISAKNNVVAVSGRKSGPNYAFFYTNTDCDVFAVYCPDVKKVAYVPIGMLCGGKTIALRLQHAAVYVPNAWWFSSFTDFKEALRGHTYTAVTSKVDGEDMVQTYNLPVKKRKKSVRAATRRATKIDWPSDTELLELTKNNSMVAVGKLLGVSDNAIRKRLKARNLC